MCSNVYWLTLFSLTDMAVHLSFLLIFTGLTGIDSITTLRKAAVEPGGSITIPCHYGSQYRNHVKYLCEGNYFSFCSIVVQTNTQHHSSRFAISDNKPQRIFTVIINNLTEMDTGYYWCGVEINGWSDDGNYFHLSVNRGTPSLYVVQQAITVSNGFNITINCHYKNSGEMKWCRLGGACVAGSSGTIDGTRVTINGSSPDVFTVIMSELTTESSGWYNKESNQQLTHCYNSTAQSFYSQFCHPSEFVDCHRSGGLIHVVYLQKTPEKQSRINHNGPYSR
ncbi:polymeric immunoglobulin receptor-like isoform X4 [Mastacembelus armatus]|uniref:polymeric immunoglobulin receptor-like isoform X4 n=1 Tax=Mastacembelus armatus TaxID=205130 RepID=UPI000E465864|nr:polymeric immunoglobulin receptor-like isoform X4 [Mastacembelus armatus]